MEEDGEVAVCEGRGAPVKGATTDVLERNTETGAQRCTLTDWVRSRADGILEPIARPLSRVGVDPNAITIAGFLLQVGVATLFFLGRIRLGGVLLALVAPLDALDGAVARAGGRDGPFGAFLDSTLDRLSDAALILGLAAHQLRRGAMLEVAVLVVALVSALMVSYARARAEALDISCKVGLLTRLERILLIAVLAALGMTGPLAWALALLSTVTFVQRVVHVRVACSRHQ